MRKDHVTAATVERLQAKVQLAAGRAAAVAPLTHTYVETHMGTIDPIAAWLTMTQPKSLLGPDDVLGSCDQALGRLQTLILKAEAEAPPSIGAAAMHPLVWGAARRLWNDRHFRLAVATAADALVHQVKALTGRYDLSETALWQETFSSRAPQPGKPRLRWPGTPGDRDVDTMNEGLRGLAAGIQLTIRNPAVHSLDEMTEQEALERLAVLSLLAGWVEHCNLVQAPEP